jgi:hypothetical protein
MELHPAMVPIECPVPQGWDCSPHPADLNPEFRPGENTKSDEEICSLFLMCSRNVYNIKY